MSTIAYAALTARRELSSLPDVNANRDDAAPVPVPSTSNATSLGTYVDVLAALVPAEVLAAHAVILSVTTSSVIAAGSAMTTITAPNTLRFVFVALMVLSSLLYVLAHRQHWDQLDYLTHGDPATRIRWLDDATEIDSLRRNRTVGARWDIGCPAICHRGHRCDRDQRGRHGALLSGREEVGLG